MRVPKIEERKLQKERKSLKRKISALSVICVLSESFRYFMTIVPPAECEAYSGA